MAKIIILDAYKTTTTALESSNPKVTASIYLKYPNYKQWLKLKPKKRIEAIRTAQNEQFEAFKTDLAALSVDTSKMELHQIEVTLPYQNLLQIEPNIAIERVFIHKIDGVETENEASDSSFFGVKARCVIQVEGQKRGQQSVEERILLVRAKSFKQAKKRVQKAFKKYETPYLNTEGYQIIWKLDKIVEVYDTGVVDIKEFDSKEGVEVFSRIKSRKLKNKHILPKLWK
ncbi:MAG: DUF4288 domain-containing protein [Saprospiraceae bacterium]